MLDSRFGPPMPAATTRSAKHTAACTIAGCAGKVDSYIPQLGMDVTLNGRTVTIHGVTVYKCLTCGTIETPEMRLAYRKRTTPGRWMRECEYCTKPFTPRAQGQPQIYCDPQCAQDAHVKRAVIAKREARAKKRAAKLAAAPAPPPFLETQGIV